MQLISLITADVLFLILVVIGVTLDRRISRLEFEREEADMKEETAYLDLALELEELKRRVGEHDGRFEDGSGRDRDDGKRFSEGVASILGYDLHRPAVFAGGVRESGGDGKEE